MTYVTAGAGHRRAAEALAQAAAAAHPSATVECVDVLTYAPRWFHAGYAWTYLFLVRHVPWVWQVSYGLLDHGLCYTLVQPVRRLWNLWIARRFTAWLKAAQPDVILTTHFLPADVASAGKAAGWLRSALVVVVTDLYPHRFWISREPEAFVVSTPESAAALERRGVPRERIAVLGIPIARAFAVTIWDAFACPADRDALRARFGLDAGGQTVLVTSGGTTVGQFERVVKELLALGESLSGRLQLLVVCGEDKGARARLEARARSSATRLTVFGFVDFMADLMAVSDLIVAKAGGLTVSEALGRAVPVILYHVIPGQEQMNARYLAEHGAGVIATRPADVVRAVRSLIDHPERLAAMAEAAKRISRPNAAEDIASQVIGPLLLASPRREVH